MVRSIDGAENSGASMVPSWSAWKISPACRSCVATPSFCMTLAPRPKKRIFSPLRSSTDLISLRNQPDASGGMMPHTMVVEAELGSELVEHLLTTAKPIPAEVFPDLGPESHRRVQRHCNIL